MRNSYAPYLALLIITLFFGLLVWRDSHSAYTQADSTVIHQLTSQHQEVVGSSPSGFTELNGAVYFGITSEKGGLWKTDGTAQGTVLVKDLAVAPYSLQRLGDQLYFAVYDEGYNAALWKSDGTSAGTVLLKSNVGISSYPFAAIGNIVYFSAFDPIHGSELWQSDGTPAGTTLVADLKPGSESTYPGGLVANGSLLYFTGYDDLNRRTLWQSDGTPAGTRVVTGAPDYPDLLVVMQNVLYFRGSDQSHGEELWRYVPGDPAPSLVLDIAPGAESAALYPIVPINQRLFFAARNAEHGRELWQSDGTAAGTQIVKELALGPTSASIGELINVDGLLYFSAMGGDLWKSDGTAQGTQLVKGAATFTPSLYGATGLNGLLYFLVSGAQTGWSLWKSDGTDAGTTVVKEAVIDGYAGSRALTAIGGKLYFSGYDVDHSSELWVSDGTTTGTAFVKDLDSTYRGPTFSNLTRVNTRLYFITNTAAPFSSGDEQLWMSESAATPARLIDDQLSNYQVQAFGDSLFFTGYGGNDFALWKHSGASGAPELVRQFAKQPPSNLIVLQNHLFFQASDALTNTTPIYDLWRSDGTANGTIKLVAGDAVTPPPSPRLVFNGQIFATRGNEIWVLKDSAASSTHFVPTGLQGFIGSMVSTPNALYFIASEVVDPFSDIDTIWRSDGTLQGTHQLTADPAISYIWGLFPVDNSLYLIASGVGTGNALWYNDGVSPTLTRLAALTPARYYTNFSWMTLANGQLFFTADDGVHGPELWKSNGTPEGTVLVKDIIPAELADVPAAYPGPLFEFRDLLYLGINDGIYGQELWRSDGTAAGTTLFKDINPGADSASPTQFIEGTTRFFFSATDGVHGRELWQSDGTPAGTTLVTDLYVGAAGARPDLSLLYNDTLWFIGNNGLDGRQLFAVEPTLPLALPEAEEPLLPLPNRLYLPLVQQ